MERCFKCGAELCQLDKALHRKLVNRGAESFMCKSCLSKHFNIEEKQLDELAEFYKKQGCMLFN